MREFASLADLGRQFQRVAENLPKQIERELKVIGQEVKAAAQAEYGHYQPDQQSPQGEGFPEWADLAESTEIEKAALGYNVEAPVLREGDVRDSVQFELSGAYSAESVTVGSTNPIAGYQEFGTASIPPRPAIGPAMATRMDHNNDRLLDAVSRAFEV